VKMPDLNDRSPLQILKELRSIQKAVNLPWSCIADQVRPQCEKIWNSWSEQDRKRFLRHAKSYWEIIRHRVPGSIHQELNEAIAARELQVLSGRIVSVHESGDRIQVTFSDRRTNKLQHLSVDWIILATGAPIDQELVRSSKLQGIRCCPNGFGYINERAAKVW